MKIAIKNPSPLGPNLQKWGDYHFGLSLARALERRGVTVVQHFWPEWDKDDGEDAIIVLRGKRRHQMKTRKLAVLWVISHPTTVSLEEMEEYDLVYLASQTHHALVKDALGARVDVLRQCTDTTLFHTDPNGDGADKRRDIVFVANSRGVRRDIVQWALDADVVPTVTGRHWGGIGLSRLVKREFIENSELPELYRNARLSLNDHWGDMLHLGYINNRIFDCIACGVPVLSDAFPELKSVCGDQILYASDTVSFWEAVRTYYLRYPEVLEKTRSLWSKLGSDYTFDARAARIVEQLNTVPQRKGRSGLTQYQNSDSEKPAAAGVAQEIHDMLDLCHSTLRGLGAKGEIQLLHIFPTATHSQWIASNDSYNYLSGGIGVGPWHLALRPEVDNIADKRFDLVILDNELLLQNIGEIDRAKFLKSLAMKVKDKGILAVVDQVSHKQDLKILEVQGLSRVSSGNTWLLLGGKAALKAAA